MTETATCPECSIGWRGPSAHTRGLEHETQTNHVVWYDTNPDTTEEDSGPLKMDLE